MPPMVAALLLLAAVASTTASHPSPLTLLPVGVLLRPELIPLGSAGSPVAGKRYSITGLAAHTPYEVRVSHPSTIPASVGIHVEEEAHGGQPAGTHASQQPRTAAGGRRSLLDTTRAPVRGGGGGGAASAPATIILTITATTKGFYAPGLGPPSHLPIAITVQPLLFGGLMPADCGPVLAAAAALGVGVAVLVVPWWAEGGARVVGGWLDGGEAANGLVDGRVGGRGDGEAGGVERARKAR